MNVSDQKLRAPMPIGRAKKAARVERRQRVTRVSEPPHAVNLTKLTSLAGYLIRKAQLWVFQDFNVTLAPLDLRPAQYSILTTIRDNPGLSQMALSQVLGIVRSGMVPLLDNLESKKLLKRTTSAADRRSHALYLTPEGDAFLDRADTLVQEHENRLIKKLGVRGHQQLLQILGVFGKQK
jgi:DNA-binding MarR family transcriptional regulator